MAAVNPLAITAAATVAALIVPFVLRVLDRRHPERARAPAKPDAATEHTKLRRDRLHLVRSEWIDKQLIPSLDEAEPLLPVRLHPGYRPEPLISDPDA